MERNWTLALMLSLAAHGALAWAIAHGGLFNFSDPTLARANIAKEQAQPQLPPPIIVALAKPALPKIELPLETPIGVPGSKGEAFNAVEGNKQLQARQAEEEQAFLRREKPGNKQPRHEIENKPTPQHKPTPPKENRAVPSPVALAHTNPQPAVAASPAIAFGIADGDPTLPQRKGEKLMPLGNLPKLIASKGNENPQLAHPAVKPQPAVAAIAKPQLSAQPQPAQSEQAVTASASGNAPAASVLSDSESDAFSKKGSADFIGGRLIAKGGRWVHTVNPDITIAGQLDIASMSPESRYIVMRVDVDELGSVTDVDIIKSTGAVSTVDLPCRVAMFKWRFEPPKDKTGKPHADTMIWTINFR